MKKIKDSSINAVKQLLEALDKKELLLKNKRPDDYDLLIFERRLNTFSIMGHLFSSRASDDNKRGWLDAVKQFGFNEKEIEVLPWIVEMQYLLGSYEQLKRSLLQVINLDKKTSPQIKDGVPLGNIIRDLGKILKKNYFEGFINTRLRNALGHDDWWIENGKFFCYRENRKSHPIKLTLEQYTDEVIRHNIFSKSFYHEYSTNYCNPK